MELIKTVTYPATTDGVLVVTCALGSGHHGFQIGETGRAGERIALTDARTRT